MNKAQTRHYLAAAVAVITFIVYLPALQNDFVLWDDDLYVTANPNIRTFNAEFIRWAFLNLNAYNWHPLTWISYALDFAVWGQRPFGHHLTSIILHALNTFLVVLICIRLVDAEHAFAPHAAGGADRVFPSGAALVGALTGSLFGLHPLHVESVAWVAERKDVLCGLFYLLSLQAYMKYLHKNAFCPRAITDMLSRYRDAGYLQTLMFFLLALMSKPMAVSLPVVLLVLEWYPYRRIRTLQNLWMSLLEKLPFILLTACVAAITIIAQNDFMNSMQQVHWSERALVSMRSIALYLRTILIPTRLSPFYPYPSADSIHFGSLEYAGAATLLLGCTLYAILVVRKQRLWIAVWFYFLAVLLPVAGFIQVGGQFMADRYLYLPSIGPFMIIGIAGARAWTNVGRVAVQRRARTLRNSAILISVLIIVSLSFLTVRQIAIWKNSITLWTAVIERYPDSAPVAYNNRALAYRSAGQADRALEDLNTVIRLASGDAEAYNNRGMVLGEMGRYDEAIEDFTEAIALDKTHYAARLNRAIACRITGRTDRALSDLAAAIALDSSRYEAYNLRASMLLDLGKFKEAVQDGISAIAVNPGSFEAYFYRGIALSELGRYDDATQDCTDAIALNASDFRAYQCRGTAYRKAGRLQEAIEDYTRMVFLNPDLAEGYEARGDCYAESGDSARAAQDYVRACDQGNSTACGKARATKGR